jgi:hypothetical protein
LIGEGSSDTFSAPTGGFELKVQGSGGATVAMALHVADGLRDRHVRHDAPRAGASNPNSGHHRQLQGAGRRGDRRAIIVNPGMGDFQ